MAKHCELCNSEYGTSTAGCLNPKCDNYYAKPKLMDALPDDVCRVAPKQFDDGYELLRLVLLDASEQASKTKGVERHASGESFEQQKICQGGRKFGVGAPLYQTWKKTEEAYRMATSGKFENGKERAIQELYGAINYAAAAIIILNEQIKKELEND